MHRPKKETKTQNFDFFFEQMVSAFYLSNVHMDPSGSLRVELYSRGSKAGACIVY